VQQPPPVSNARPRVVGLDVHPDSFTASIVEGPTPLSANVLKTFNKVPIAQLGSWAAKHTLPTDTLVLEASGNSFEAVRRLRTAGRTPLVLESVFIGRLKEAHANNDRISAVRIARAYLSGNARTVWVPDESTQRRRDLFHAHRKAVRGVTAANNSLVSYLSDNGVRLGRTLLKLAPAARRESVLGARAWNPTQLQVLEIHLLGLEHQIELEARLSSLLAQQVLEDPRLLELTRLCGIRDVIAFAIGAIVGDVTRFPSPRSLVKYVGLNPAFDDSGEKVWKGGIKGHGRKDLRSLLIEAGHSILRSRNHPHGEWGRKLLARKGEVAVVVAALARKLITQVWYSLQGRTEPMVEPTKSMSVKIGRIVSKVGKDGLARLGLGARDLRRQAFETLRTRTAVREYLLRDDPSLPDPGTSSSVPAA
jgi:transposase